MRFIGQEIRSCVTEVLTEWDRLVREEPWFSLPPENRRGELPDVIAAIAAATLCYPDRLDAHRSQVEAAALHGERRRAQGLPEHVIPSELHLLRQALWRYLTRRHGSSDRTTSAILRIDRGITVATNAAMWGYYRDEIEGMGKWEEGMDRIAAESGHTHGPEARGGGKGDRMTHPRCPTESRGSLRGPVSRPPQRFGPS
jgi:hypothetical protein